MEVRGAALLRTVLDEPISRVRTNHPGTSQSQHAGTSIAALTGGQSAAPSGPAAGRQQSKGSEPMSAFPPYAFSGSYSISRRGFISGAAAIAAALPAAPVWADATSGSGDVAAIGLSGKPVTLTAADIKDLRAGFTGQLLLVQDAGYDQARRV